MNEDLLADARKRIVEESTKAIEVPPQDLESLSERFFGGMLRSGSKDAARGSAGVALGTAIGLKTGFAFLGTAVSGAWVLAPLFGLAMVVAGQAMDDES